VRSSAGGKRYARNGALGNVADQAGAKFSSCKNWRDRRIFHAHDEARASTWRLSGPQGLGLPSAGCMSAL
jgi:hypothetical protein